MVGKLTRNEFTQSIQDKKIDVQQAKADPKLAGVDVAKADLDRDGKISGAAEATALFKEVDRYDTNGDAASINLTAADGSQARAAVVATTLQARAVFETVEPPPKDAALKNAFAAADSLPLAKGATGDRAVAVQYALARLGLPIGSVDGQFGPGTERNVKAFQTSAGLPATGIVDAATLRALDSKVSGLDLRTPAEKSGNPLQYLANAALQTPKLAPLTDRTKPINWSNPEIQKAYGSFVGAYWEQLKGNRIECDCKTLSLFFMDQFRAKAKADLGVDLPRPNALPGDTNWVAATASSPQGFFSRFENLATVRPGYDKAQALQRLDPSASMLAGVNLRFGGTDANMAARAVKQLNPWNVSRDNAGDQLKPELPVEGMNPGDLIVIDHTGDGRYDHMANVVKVDRDASGKVTSMVIATGSYDDMKDADGSTAPNSLGEVNNYAEEVTITFDAAGKVSSSKVTWSSEPSWLVDGRYSARTLLMEMRPNGVIASGKWA